MELKIKVDYQELISLIRQLPASKIARLKKELTDSLIEDKVKAEKGQLRQFLLNGPVMSEEEYQDYKQTRKWMNQWRAK